MYYSTLWMGIARMSNEYKTDEIRSYINQLYDSGATGTSYQYMGISLVDEAHITALLIQATPYIEVPKLDLLDIHQGLYILIARAIDSNDAKSHTDLGNYIRDLYLDHYKDKIKQLMDDAAHERELVQQK
jgi:hypothetical protein